MMSSSSLVQKNLLNGVQVTPRRLGAGGYGAVFLGKWHGRYVAVKLLHPTEMGSDENGRPTKGFLRFIKELPILQQLSHPSIVQVFGMARPPAHDASHGLVMELLPVTLRDRYQQEPQLTDDQEISIMTSLASGLQYLHHKEIIHRDLTTSNVMMVERAGCESMPVPAKIIDAGVARVLADVSEQETMTLSPGADNYMAPEARTECHDQKVEYGYPADVYSLGLTVMAMCNRREPPPIASLVVKGLKSDLALIRRLRPFLYNLVSKCVEEDPNVRPTCLQLCEELAPLQQPYSAASASQRSGDGSVTYTDDDVAPLRDTLLDVTKERDALHREKVQLTGDLGRATAAREQAIKEREEAIKECEEAVTEANAERERAVEETQHQSKLLNECATKCKQLEEHSVRYRKQLAHARAEHGEVAAKYQELFEERNQLQRQIGITKEHGEAKCQELVEERNQLRQQIRIDKEELDQMSVQCRELKEHYDRQQKNLDAKEAEHGDVAAKYQELVEECDRLQGQISIDKEEVDQMSAENTELTKKHNELKEEYDRQQKNLVAKEAELDNLGRECHKLAEECHQLVEERDAVIAQRETLQQQLANTKEEHDRKIAEIEDKLKLADERAEDNDELKEKNALLDKQLKATIMELGRLNKKYENQGKPVNQLTGACDQPPDENCQHQQQLAAAELQRDCAIATTKCQEECVTELTAKCDNISAERDEMAAQSRQYQEQLAAVTAERDRIAAEHDQLVAKNSQQQQRQQQQHQQQQRQQNPGNCQQQ